MGDILDMSLDDLIDQKKSTVSKTSKSPGNIARNKRGGSTSSRGRGRGGRAVRNPVGIGSRLRQRRAGTAGVGKKSTGDTYTKSAALRVVEASGGVWRHDKFEEGVAAAMGSENGAAGAPLETGSKLLVSNLEKNVSSIELKELFSNIGPVKRASVNCDENGKSKGSAEVIFSRKADALRAIKEYNGRQLDGQPLKIDMVQSVAASTVPVKVTPAPRPANITRGTRASSRATLSRGSTRGRGRGRSSSRGGKPKTPLTSASLDADLDVYMQE